MVVPGEQEVVEEEPAEVAMARGELKVSHTLHTSCMSSVVTQLGKSLFVSL